MRVLSLDRSLPQGVAALWEDGACVWRKAWAPEVARSPEWVTDLTREVSDLKNIDCYFAGTGPGSFSGARGAIAFLQGLALPLGRPVLGVSTIEAIRYRLGDGGIVAGDARRGQLWVFDGEFRLVPVAEFTPQGRVFSPEAERLQKLFPQGEFVQVEAEPEDIGRLVVARGIETFEAARPIYLQPAV